MSLSNSDGDNPTIPIRSGEEFDLSRLFAYLRQLDSSLSEVPSVSQFPGGKSNLTYLLRFEDREWVLRRPPFGTKAKSAHDMGREYRIIRSLQDDFETVPRVIDHCADPSIIGTEFYLMEKVDGILVQQSIPPDWNWGVQETNRFCLAFWDRLIALHRLDFKSLNLGDLARPAGYIERQIHGWNRRYRRAMTPDAPDCENVMEWLVTRIPAESQPCLIHNDYRIDNIIWCKDRPDRVAAVLDWEMATVGYPLMDLGNSLAYWIEATDGPGTLKAVSQPSHAEGMLTRREVLSYYSAKTGQDVDGFDFYYVAGLFRLAVIIQQIYYRFFHGQTQDVRFAEFGDEVRRLSERCQAIMDGLEI